jgi:hypothetical protein
LYKFETSVFFEVLPLRLDTPIPKLLPMLETLSKIANCWRPFTAFPLKILDNVSSIGSSFGIGASSRRGGGTSKETEVSKLYKYLNKFFNNSGNFWVPPHRYGRLERFYLPDSSDLKIEAGCSSETFRQRYNTTRRHNP